MHNIERGREEDPMGRTAFYHFYSVGSHAVSTPLASLEEALVARKKGGFLWIACVSPERAELESIARELSIHPLSVADCFDEDQIPKIDAFPEYTEILFNDIVSHADAGPGAANAMNTASVGSAVSIAEINLFFGGDFIVSVFRDETAVRVTPEAIIDDVMRLRPRGIHGPARILHALLDRVIALSFSAVDAASDGIAELEDECLLGSGSIAPAKAHAIRQSLTLMRKSLFHERELLARLARKDSPLVPEESLIYFSDLYDHVAKFLGTVETDRDALTNLAQLALAISGNEMARQAAKTNRSMTRLTFITTIFMPLTLVAGIGGMSEWTMMTGPENWKRSYAILLGAMAFIGVANYLALKWLNRKS
jgi:magnesium transporter